MLMSSSSSAGLLECEILMLDHHSEYSVKVVLPACQLAFLAGYAPHWCVGWCKFSKSEYIVGGLVFSFQVLWPCLFVSASISFLSSIFFHVSADISCSFFLCWMPNICSSHCPGILLHVAASTMFCWWWCVQSGYWCVQLVTSMSKWCLHWPSCCLQTAPPVSHHSQKYFRIHVPIVDTLKFICVILGDLRVQFS